MNLEEILKMFESEENILLLLQELMPIFEKINDYAQIFQNHKVSINSEECKKALDELTGLYMYLNPIYSVTKAIKQNKEDQFYTAERKKIESSLDGKRFISAPLDRAASAHVGNYRIVRNILGKYVESCDKAISSCQSILKYMSEEIKLSKN